MTNLAISGTLQQVEVLVANGVIEPLCSLLDAKDPQVVHVALDGLNNILKKYNMGFSVIAEEIERCGGLDKIESLQTHENADVYELAYELIDTFFADDKDEDGDLQPKATEAGFEFGTSDAVQSTTPADSNMFRF